MPQPNYYPAAHINPPNVLGKAAQAARTRYINTQNQLGQSELGAQNRLLSQEERLRPLYAGAAQGDEGAIRGLAAGGAVGAAGKYLALDEAFAGLRESKEKSAILGMNQAIDAWVPHMERSPLEQQTAWQQFKPQAESQLGLPPGTLSDQPPSPDQVRLWKSQLKGAADMLKEQEFAKTKKALDRESGQEVFATEEDIATNPNLGPPASKGMEIVSDGKGGFTVRTGVPTGGGVELTKPTRTKLEGKQLDASDMLARTQAVRESFKPSFATWFGEGGSADRFKMWTKGKLGLESSPQEEATYREASIWQRRTAEGLSAYLNQLSGAAISPEEAKRLTKVVASEEDDPIKFQAKVDDVLRQTSIGIARYGLSRKYGLEINVQITDSIYGHDGKPGAVDKIGEAIFDKLTAGGMSDEDARAAAMEELKTYFGGIQ